MFSKLHCLTNICRGPTKVNIYYVTFWLVTYICQAKIICAGQVYVLTSCIELAPVNFVPDSFFVVVSEPHAQNVQLIPVSGAQFIPLFA